MELGQARLPAVGLPGPSVDPAGIEPASPGFQPSADPSQLGIHVVGAAGFEPATTCSQGRWDNQASLHPSRDSPARTDDLAAPDRALCLLSYIPMIAWLSRACRRCCEHPAGLPQSVVVTGPSARSWRCTESNRVGTACRAGPLPQLLIPLVPGRDGARPGLVVLTLLRSQHPGTFTPKGGARTGGRN